ncbi:collagen alpha-1(X) chain isoform X1 [Oryzias melastigma]|nr:collagen alpha-1(X) chain isoform X1 [Oryzias melastigma]
MASREDQRRRTQVGVRRMDLGRAEMMRSRREEMLVQLVFRLSVLLSGLQPASSFTTTGFPLSRSNTWSATKCEFFPPPPLPPPMFLPINRKAGLMVDITEHITGSKGEKGCKGTRGKQGLPGLKGQSGEAGLQGAFGLPGPKGEKGDQGWRGLYGDIGTPGLIKGSKGLAGLRGEKGFKGSVGLSGEKGKRGTPGEPGEKGHPGQQGNTGQKGGMGPRGDMGPRGSMGLRGSHGHTGLLGNPGPAGPPGLPGEPGLPGQVYILPGLQGDPGSQGASADTCSCAQVQRQKGEDLEIFIADGEKDMRKLRIENTLVLRTDRRALYLFAESQWINVLVASAAYRNMGLEEETKI